MCRERAADSCRWVLEDAAADATFVLVVLDMCLCCGAGTDDTSSAIRAISDSSSLWLQAIRICSRNLGEPLRRAARTPK
eukprot:399178-Pyramimonas_sp.AAC.1